MKIAYIAQSYPPMMSGAALVVERLAHAMAARGHDVFVISASDRKHPYVDRSGRVKVFRVQSHKNPLRVDQKFTVWQHREIRDALEDFEPDVLHSHDTLSMGLAGLFSAQQLAVPAAVTIHQLPWFVSTRLDRFPMLSNLTESGLWNYSIWLLAQFESVIAPSEMIAAILRRKSRCLPEVIGNGVDLRMFSPTPRTPGERERLMKKYRLDPHKPILLYIGRIDADKQVDLLALAAAQAFQSVDAQFLVIGDGRDRERVMELCTELEIMDRCRFPGFVSNREELAAIYRLGTVFATASEIEIQSSVVLEASSSGVPVVAFAASSMPEFIQDGHSGYLAPPKDVSTMAGQIVDLLSRPDCARAMGAAGRAFARNHSLERSYNAHEALYERVSESASQWVGFADSLTR